MPNPESALIVPRKKIHFTPLQDGKFVGIASNVPDSLKQPLVRTQDGSVNGIESGWRSGLLVVNGEMYKLKGCRPTGREHGNQPEGSQTLSSAEYEADRISERREALLKEGVLYPMEPVGLWVYPGFTHKGEPNAATIFRVMGDTRLDEFMRWAEKDLPYDYMSDEARQEINEKFIRLGIMTGQILRYLHNHNFSWDSGVGDASNAHHGNVLLFPNNGKVGLSIVDFDNSLDSTIQYQDTGKEEVPFSAIQKHDYDNFAGRILNHEVVSSASPITYEPWKAPWELTEGTLKKIAPDLLDKNRVVAAYILNLLDRDRSSLRLALKKAFEEGYSQESLSESGIAWDDLRSIRRYIGEQRRDLVSKVESKLGPESDREQVIFAAEQLSRARGKLAPLIVGPRKRSAEALDPKGIILTDLTEQRKDELKALSRRFLALHQNHIAKYPSSGEDYFTFPKASQEIVESHANIKSGDLVDLVRLWIDGDLQEVVVEHNPRAVGSFILGLAQINEETLSTLKALTPNRNDPELITKLVRIDQLLILFSDHYLYDYMKGLIDDRHDYYLEQEISKKSAIALFGYGIVTRHLHEIFNHDRIEIALDGFGTEQIPAILEAFKCPKRIDDHTDSANYLLPLALTSIQVRSGQQENLALISSKKWAVAKGAFLKYLFASEDKDSISDSGLKDIMESPSSNGGWFVSTIEYLLKSGKYLHPNSYFADSLGNTDFKADGIARIFKVALDMTDGDLSKLDPIIKGLFEKKYAGRISSEHASAIVLACIGFGTDLPASLDPYLEDTENKKPFMDFFSEDYIGKRTGIYDRSESYPEDPICKLMSQGMQALPNKVKKLFSETVIDQKIINALGKDFFSHLFAQDFRDFFGKAILDPRIGSKRKFWKLIHPDMWNILSAVDSDTLTSLFNSQVQYGRKVYMTVADGKHESVDISHYLPPRIYKRILAARKNGPRKKIDNQINRQARQATNLIMNTLFSPRV